MEKLCYQVHAKSILQLVWLYSIHDLKRTNWQWIEGLSSHGWWLVASAWSSTGDLLLLWLRWPASKSRCFTAFPQTFRLKAWFVVTPCYTCSFYSALLRLSTSDTLCTKWTTFPGSGLSPGLFIFQALETNCILTLRYFLVTSNYFFYGETLMEQFGVVINRVQDTRYWSNQTLTWEIKLQ